MKNLFLFCCVIAFTVSAWSQASKDEQAIRDLDKSWSQAANDKNLDKTISYYADDASVLPFNAPLAKGIDQIRPVWQHLMSTPGFGLTFTPTSINVARSGDMAYEIGAFKLKVNDAQGQPSMVMGKYVVAWKKISGKWKVEADIFNTDK